MAKLTTEELLDQFAGLTLVELSDFVKAFEEKFDVTAAAPVAVAGSRAGTARRRVCSRRRTAWAGCVVSRKGGRR